MLLPLIDQVREKREPAGLLPAGALVTGCRMRWEALLPLLAVLLACCTSKMSNTAAGSVSLMAVPASNAAAW